MADRQAQHARVANYTDLRGWKPLRTRSDDSDMAYMDLAVVSARKVMRMKWPSTLADGDAVIVRDETRNGLRFVVHSRSGPQLACRTYAEAEAQAFAYTEHARAHAWYADRRGLQLIGSHDRAISLTRRQGGVTPHSNQPVHRREDP